MPKPVKYMSLSLLAALGFYAFFCTALFDAKSPAPAATSFLLEKSAKDPGNLALPGFRPGALGEWTIAFAQVLDYHGLSPKGKVDILDQYGVSAQFQLDTLSRLVGPHASEEQVFQWGVASALGKKFGTPHYAYGLVPSFLVERHFAVDVSRTISWRKWIPYTMDKQEQIIRAEIAAKRPLVLHMANLDGKDHTVVIDGCKYMDNRFYVHLNLGRAGAGNGWYRYYTNLMERGDQALRVLYAIQPL